MEVQRKPGISEGKLVATGEGGSSLNLVSGPAIGTFSRDVLSGRDDYGGRVVPIVIVREGETFGSRGGEVVGIRSYQGENTGVVAVEVTDEEVMSRKESRHVASL